MCMAHGHNQIVILIGPCRAPWKTRVTTRAWLSVLLLGTVCASPGAGNGALPATPYFFQTWSTDEGLPQSSVSAIVQTREGYLWLGTYGGLVRFDGVRFVVFESGNTPELVSSRVTALAADEGGRLWIGHENGAVTLWETGKFRPFPLPESWGTGKVLAIVPDGGGRVWLADEEGVLFDTAEGRRLVPVSGVGRGLISVVGTPHGEIWIARNGRASVLRAGALEAVDFGESPEAGFVQGLCASTQGGLWVCRNGRLRRWHGGQWVEDRGEAPWHNTGVPVMLESKDGSLVAGTTELGLFLVPPAGPPLHFTRTNGLPQDWVRALYEDREGNLWLGVGSAGLVAMRAGQVWTPSPPDRWQGRAVLSVYCTSDGALWVGTEGAGLYRWHLGQWERFGQESGLANLFVWSVGEDEAGRIWAGTWGGGVFVRGADGRFAPPPGLEELSVPVLAILRGQHGQMWLGTGEGLILYRHGQVRVYGRNEGLQSPDVRALWAAADGSIWFAMSGGGLGRWQAGSLQQWLRKDGLPTDYVQCLWMDPAGGLWLGTAGAGLVRFRDNAFTVIGPAQGLPNGVICHITPDDWGYLWMSSYGGLLRVAKSALERAAESNGRPVEVRVYGKGEGMPTLECSGGLQPAGCQTPDGRLWFATSKGLVGVDPTMTRTNPDPPPVLIEEIWVNDRLIAQPALDPRPAQIPPGRHRLEFRFTGLSFVAPDKVRFRFRLMGVDPSWIDGGPERTAVYQYLPPGEYEFQVTACNNDGVWNPAVARAVFVIAPWFWQTWWFRSLTAVAAAGALAGGVAAVARARLRRRLERLERQQAVERERARIAKDMHDELGASLTRITLLSQTARSELDDPQSVAESLDRIYGTARELTRALDEIVWAVNPQHDTLDSLATYLGRFAQEFLAAARVRCRLDVPVHLPPWPLTAEVRHNLFLAFKEALHNAVKHAGATEVRITLELSPQAFRLAVQDNGRGLTADALGSSNPRPQARHGHGLTNIRQRLADIGGHCEILSQPGKGTRLVFIVPKSPQGK